jgi:type IV secretory pathway VirB4 component
MVYAKRKTVQTGWTGTGRRTTFHRLINALTTFSQHFTDNAPIHLASAENEVNIYHAHIVAFDRGNSLAIEATRHSIYR